MTSSTITETITNADVAQLISQETPFDPSEKLVNLGGKGMYLEVKWRLVWLRREHPDALIETELVKLEERDAIFKARVTIPNGGGATGWGSESASDFRDFIEKAECLDEDAEILTRLGFRHHSDVRVGDDVLAYDLATDTCAWVPVDNLSVFPNIVSYALGNRAKWRIRGTANHKWAVLNCNNERILRQASDLRASDRIILAAREPLGGSSPLTTREAALIGWIVTDGGIKRVGDSLTVTITQSKPATVSMLVDLVGGDGTETVGPPTIRAFPSGKTYPCLPQHTFRLHSAFARALFDRAGITGRDDLPQLIARLRPDARAAMLDAMMLADGDKRGYFSKKRHPAVMEAWQLLCTLEGIAVSPLKLRGDNQPTQKLKKRRYLSASQLALTDGSPRTVWCPTTRYGTWVCRQNGVITITGNTKAIGRALAALGYGTQFCDDHAGLSNAGHSEGYSRTTGQPRIADAPVQPRDTRDYTRSNGHQQPPSKPAATNGNDPGNQRATERQVKFIGAIARESGLDDQELAAWSQELYGMAVDQLNRRDASTLIEALQRRRNEIA